MEKEKYGDDPDNKAVDNMIPVDIPDGVSCYKNEVYGEKAICQYGLERMLACSVPNFKKESEDSTDIVDGQMLVFQPGDFLVYATRLDLNAEEINRIGQLVADLDTNYNYHQYLTGAVKQLEDVLRVIRPLELSRLEPKYVIGESKNTRMTDEAINKDIEELGVIVNRMRERLPELDSAVRSLKISLKDLGISLVRSGGAAGKSFPIGKEEQETE